MSPMQLPALAWSTSVLGALRCTHTSSWVSLGRKGSCMKLQTHTHTAMISTCVSTHTHTDALGHEAQPGRAFVSLDFQQYALGLLCE